MTPARDFIVSTLAVAGLALAAVGTLNAWVDPSMQYRVPSYQPRFSSGYARQINAGLARNLAYDAVIVGSSYAMNFRNSDFDREFGGRTISLAMPGMFVSEARKAIDYAATQRRIGSVYFGLDFFAFDESQNKYDFPDYLYDDSILNDSPYLLSLDTTKRSLNIVADRALGSFNTDRDSPWSWARNGARFDRGLALSDYAKYRSNPPRALPLDRMRAQATEQIDAMLRQHPATVFHFFLPPYSALTWIAHDEAGNLNHLLAFRVYLADLIARHPNGHLHDFQSMTELICNLDHYTDIGHYGPDDSRMLVSAMRSGKYLASPQVVHANNEVLRDAARKRCSGSIPVLW